MDENDKILQTEEQPVKRKGSKPKAPAKDPKQNLIPFSAMSPEERRKIASKGGKAAAEAKQRNKTFKEAMAWALEQPAVKGNPTVEKVRKKYPLLNNRDAMAIAMTAEAIQKQNVRAFVAVRDTTGELPEQTVNVKNDGKMVIRIEEVDS